MGGKEREERKKQKKKVKKNDKSKPYARSKASLAHLVGYQPLRGEFEIEYENDAELMLADMEFRPEDKKSENALKLQVLDIYNRKLRERIKRKEFIIQRDLLDKKTRKKNKEEMEIYKNMRPFARLHSPEEHEKMIEGKVRELKLRQRIQ